MRFTGALTQVTKTECAALQIDENLVTCAVQLYRKLRMQYIAGAPGAILHLSH